MPINPINFPTISFEGANPVAAGMQQSAQTQNLFSNLISQALQQQKMRELMPFVAPQANATLQSTQLQNEKLQTILPFLPKQLQAAIELQQAQANKQNQSAKFPLLGMPGPAGQIGAEIYLRQQQNENNSAYNANNFQSNQNPNQVGNNLTDNNPLNYADSLHNQIQSNLKKNEIDNQYKQMQTQGYTWAHLPMETRSGYIAQGMGMGIDPADMQKYINSGKNIRQIAESEGLDPDNLPPPRYFATTATKTRTQQVEQVSAELDYLSSATTQLIKPYANTFFGKSPELIKDMISSDPEKQKQFGRYIGALSVQTGLANGRVIAEGGKPGVQVMKMVKDSALKGIDKVSPFKMTDVAYEEAQKTIDQLLQRGAKIRTSVGMNPLSKNNDALAKALSNNQNKSDTSEKSPVKRKFKIVNGVLVEA